MKTQEKLQVVVVAVAMGSKLGEKSLLVVKGDSLPSTYLWPNQYCLQAARDLLRHYIGGAADFTQLLPVGLDDSIIELQDEHRVFFNVYSCMFPEEVKLTWEEADWVPLEQALKDLKYQHVNAASMGCRHIFGKVR